MPHSATRVEIRERAGPGRVARAGQSQARSPGSAAAGGRAGGRDPSLAAAGLQGGAGGGGAGAAATLRARSPRRPPRPKQKSGQWRLPATCPWWNQGGCGVAAVTSRPSRHAYRVRVVKPTVLDWSRVEVESLDEMSQKTKTQIMPLLGLHLTPLPRMSRFIALSFSTLLVF